MRRGTILAILMLNMLNLQRRRLAARTDGLRPDRTEHVANPLFERAKDEKRG
jgi:hypothetical protein